MEVNIRILELAKKLKALAEQGVGGEKINAQKMLAALCAKHSIDPALLSEEKRTRHWFQSTGATEQLMNHIIWMVCGNKQKIYGSHRKKYGAFTEVTDAQRLEILAYYQVYARALKTALKDLQTAFILRNRIWSDEEDEDEKAERKPQTAEERARTRRLIQMAEGLEHTPVYKQLAERKEVRRG